MSPYRIPGDPTSGMEPLSVLPGDKFCGSPMREVTPGEMIRMMKERCCDPRPVCVEAEVRPDEPPREVNTHILVVGLPQRNVIAEYMERVRAAEEVNMPFIPVTESIPAELHLDPSRTVIITEASQDEFSRRRHMAQRAKSRGGRKRK